MESEIQGGSALKAKGFIEDTVISPIRREALTG